MGEVRSSSLERRIVRTQSTLLSADQAVLIASFTFLYPTRSLVEQDIDYHPRAAGTKSKVSGSVLGTVRAARDFAKVLS